MYNRSRHSLRSCGMTIVTRIPEGSFAARRHRGVRCRAREGEHRQLRRRVEPRRDDAESHPAVDVEPVALLAIVVDPARDARAAVAELVPPEPVGHVWDAD